MKRGAGEGGGGPFVCDSTKEMPMGGAQVQSLTPTPPKHFGPLKGGRGGGGGHQG